MLETEVQSRYEIDHDSAATYLGKPLLRPEGPAKITGRTRFAGDLTPGNILHARLVLSPYPHGRIRAIDRSAAEKAPGVVRVLVASELNLAEAGSGLRKRDPLARDRVVYNGHPIAVVVATTEAAAADGAELVSVDIEPLPALVDPFLALDADAPQVRAADAAVDDEEASMHGDVKAEATTEVSSPNLSSTVNLELGDIAAGLAAADEVVERIYQTSWIHQGYLEPQVAVAEWNGFDRVTVWASTQAMFHTRAEVAATLGLTQQQVTIIPMPVGGGFGGKFVLIEPLTAAVARIVGQPVRLQFSRTDEFLTANPAGSSTITMRLGGNRDRTLVALEANMRFDTGSSPSSAARIAPTLTGGQYRIPHMAICSTEVLTHKAGAGSYRAPGAVAAHFAVESAVDELAIRLGLDPLEMRLHNAAAEGDLRPTNTRWPRIGLRECLELLRDQPLWQNRARLGQGTEDEQGRRLGIGLAVGGWPGGIEPAAATCRVEDDGTLTVTVGAIDLSGTHNGFRSIVAEEFSIDASKVRVIIGDSDTSPRSGATGGSKITLTVGAAVKSAAADAKRQLLAIAADQLEAAPDDLDVVDGRVQVRGAVAYGMTVENVASLTTAAGSAYPPLYGRGTSAINRNSPGFGAHLAQVAVDPQTGETDVLQYVVVQDVGRVINPAEVEGQIRGGVVQGLGWALYEQIMFGVDGQVFTGSLLDYALPRAAWVPNIDVCLLEVPSNDGPFGAKGVGEPPIIPVAAAIANAVHDATGVRLTELPMTPQRVFEALQVRSGRG